MSRPGWTVCNCDIVKMATLKFTHDLQLVGVQLGFLDEEEFLFLCDCHRSSNTEYSSKEYASFYLPSKNEAVCKSEYP